MITLELQRIDTDVVFRHTTSNEIDPSDSGNAQQAWFEIVTGSLPKVGLTAASGAGQA